VILRLCDILGKDGDLFQYFGRKNTLVGKLVAIVLSVYAIITAITTLRTMGEEIKSLTLFNTPMIYIFFFAVIIYIYGVVKGYRVCARFSTIYAPIFVVCIIAYIIFSANMYQWGNIEPIFIVTAATKEIKTRFAKLVYIVFIVFIIVIVLIVNTIYFISQLFIIR
jgi:hypothetical protein